MPETESARAFECADLSAEELEAIEKAHEIAAARFRDAGEEYGQAQREQLDFCFIGALRTGGIEELMRYVTKAEVAKKKRTLRIGYAGSYEVKW